MPRRYRVSPLRRPGREAYSTTFRDIAGGQVTRGLGTTDELEARLICDALVLLREREIERPASAPPGLHPRAVALYFGVELETVAEVAHPYDGALEVTDHGLASLGLDDRRAVVDAIARAHELRARNAELEAEVVDLRHRLEALEASTIARAAAAADRCPPMSTALELFETHLHASVSKGQADALMSITRRFTGSLKGVRTPAHVTPDHVSTWIDDFCKGADKAATRRWKARLRVGRFLNWAAKLYGFPSPMYQVPAPTAHQLQRESGEIHWHALKDVDAAIKALPDDYWKALVATLAFAGLRIAELVWLRRSDIELVGKRRQIWVSTVDDGHGGRHELKTGHSRRTVEVHPTKLWPLLKKHLAKTKGEVFAFPMPEDVKRQARLSGGHTERWVTATLSRRLSGGVGGFLPEGMSARTLRRTFGSLMLRDGKSVAEVAAAMGNTPAVVQAHYARILGSEVRVGF